MRTVFDGLEALRVARDFKPEVAFIDLHMPGMGGIELAAALKSETWAAAVCLIALSGMGGRADVDATQGAGFEGHLTKSASPHQALEIAAAQPSNVVVLFGNRERTS